MAKPRSNFEAPRIVQPGGSSGRWLWWMLFVLLAALLAWQAFEFGKQRGGFDTGICDQRMQQLQSQIAGLQQERDELQARAARFERSAQIDRTAVQQAQQDLEALQEERAQLRQETEFLKSLVSGDVSILQLSDVELTGGGQAGDYVFSLTVSKRARDNERVRGKLVVSVIGESDDEETELKQEKLGIDSAKLVLGFMNFQDIEGQISLPEGFVPTGLKVAVEPKGDTFKSFEQTFPWAVEAD